MAGRWGRLAKEAGTSILGNGLMDMASPSEAYGGTMLEPPVEADPVIDPISLLVALLTAGGGVAAKGTQTALDPAYNAAGKGMGGMLSGMFGYGGLKR